MVSTNRANEHLLIVCVAHFFETILLAMTSTTVCSTTYDGLSTPLEYLPGYRGLRHYYRVRNSQITRGHNSALTAVGIMSSPASDDGCPDTSDWESADDRNANYICAQHVANEVCVHGAFFTLKTYDVYL